MMKTIAATAMGIFLAASTYADDGAWRLIDAGPFTFLAPTSLVQVNVQGIDSLVGRYTNDSIMLSYDYGMYSDPLRRRFEKDKPPGYEEQNIVIDGKKAVIVAFSGPIREWSHQYTKSIHFADVGDGHNKLTVSASGKTPDDIVTLQKVFESIKIKEQLSQQEAGVVREPRGGSRAPQP
jgi:hypothetical protein